MIIEINAEGKVKKVTMVVANMIGIPGIVTDSESEAEIHPAGFGQWTAELIRDLIPRDEMIGISLNGELIIEDVRNMVFENDLSFPVESFVQTIAGPDSEGKISRDWFEKFAEIASREASPQMNWLFKLMLEEMPDMINEKILFAVISLFWREFIMGDLEPKNPDILADAWKIDWARKTIVFEEHTNVRGQKITLS